MFAWRHLDPAKIIVALRALTRPATGAPPQPAAPARAPEPDRAAALDERPAP